MRLLIECTEIGNGDIEIRIAKHGEVEVEYLALRHAIEVAEHPERYLITFTAERDDPGVVTFPVAREALAAFRGD